MSPREIDELYPWEVASMLDLEPDKGESSDGIDINSMGGLMPVTSAIKGA